VGFSLPTERIALLRQRMEQHSSMRLAAGMLSPPLECDVEIGLGELNADLHRWLDRCGPFGMGHPEPIFMTRNVELAAPVRAIKDRHVCLEVRTGNEAARGARFSAMGWSRRGNLWVDRCQRMGLCPGSRIDMAYRLRMKANSFYMGLELELVDIRLAAD
jgi:single-stranded-DNA-specific exonuclease